MNKFLSCFFSAYRRNYSILIRLVQECRERCDNNYVVGSGFMDFSKAFGSISHELLIIKLDAYGFNRNLVRYIYSYLKNENNFKHTLSGFSQGSILGPTLFNTFFNDIFFCILIGSAYNFIHMKIAQLRSQQLLKT